MIRDILVRDERVGVVYTDLEGLYWSRYVTDHAADEEVRAAAHTAVAGLPAEIRKHIPANWTPDTTPSSEWAARGSRRYRIAAWPEIPGRFEFKSSYDLCSEYRHGNGALYRIRTGAHKTCHGDESWETTWRSVGTIIKAYGMHGFPEPWAVERFRLVTGRPLVGAYWKQGHGYVLDAPEADWPAVIETQSWASGTR